MVEKKSSGNENGFRTFATLAFVSLLFLAIYGGKNKGYVLFDDIDTKAFIENMERENMSPLEADIAICYHHLSLARSKIRGNEYLNRLFTDFLGDKGDFVGGLEFALAITESRGKVDAESKDRAQGSLQVTHHASGSLQVSLEELHAVMGLDEEIFNEAQKIETENSDAIGLLYFAKQYSRSAEYFGNNWKKMHPYEHYQLTYLTYNAGFARMEKVFDKFDISSLDQYKHFVIERMEAQGFSYQKCLTENKDSTFTDEFARLRSLQGKVKKRKIVLREKSDGKKEISITDYKLWEALIGAMMLGESLETLQQQ